MAKKKVSRQKLIRLIAIVLAALLAGGAIVSAVISLAYAEESAPVQNHYAFEIEYLENEQALRISQRLAYTNETGGHLDRVIFYAPANLMRRQSALAYNDAAADCYPYGYAPGGIDLTKVHVNGAQTDYGFQGENEMYLRVACDLDAGDVCEFEFDYYLLLTQNRAFAGVNAMDVQLSDFYFIAADYDTETGEFVLNAPLAHTRYIDTNLASYDAEIALPARYDLAATGTETKSETNDACNLWTIHADSARAFSLIFGQRYRESAAVSESGVQIRCLTNARGAADRILQNAVQAIDVLENWFGAFPARDLDIVQAEIGQDCIINTGSIWLSESIVTGDSDTLAHVLFRALAQQYFGLTACAKPVSDAWLSDSICEYAAYLLTWELDGRDAYLRALNQNIVPSLQLTIPGGLTVTSEATLFTADEYDIVVRDRGAAVFHELATAMGRDQLIQGLRIFYRKGLSVHRLTEIDLTDAFKQASGKSWEAFLTDWLFNVDEYVNQSIDWLD